MSNAHPDTPEVTPGTGEHAGESQPSAARIPALNGGIGRAVRAGASGEDLTAAGVFAAIGGVRGVLEAVVPTLLFVLLFVITKDARLAALIPGGLALLLVIARLVRRSTVVSALSGVFGVGIATIVTLVTGRGIDYFLSGFVVNIAWGAGLLISVLVGWPAIGLLIGGLEGDFKSWRKDARIFRTALVLTVIWLGMFVARLAVQLPLYLSDRVEALGFARIAMGVPLFALIIVVTWFAIRRVRPSSDDSSGQNGVFSGENTPSE